MASSPSLRATKPVCAPHETGRFHLPNSGTCSCRGKILRIGGKKLPTLNCRFPISSFLKVSFSQATSHRIRNVCRSPSLLPLPTLRFYSVKREKQADLVMLLTVVKSIFEPVASLWERPHTHLLQGYCQGSQRFWSVPSQGEVGNLCRMLLFIGTTSLFPRALSRV